MSLVKDVEVKTHEYARKGGKDNRRQQRARMIAFAAHAQALGAREMGQVGATHVIRYWKAHRDLSDATLYSHWLAIRELWTIYGKSDQPPRPRKKIEQQKPSVSLKEKLFGRSNVTHGLLSDYGDGTPYRDRRRKTHPN